MQLTEERLTAIEERLDNYFHTMMGRDEKASQALETAKNADSISAWNQTRLNNVGDDIDSLKKRATALDGGHAPGDTPSVCVSYKGTAHTFWSDNVVSHKYVDIDGVNTYQVISDDGTCRLYPAMDIAEVFVTYNRPGGHFRG